MPRDGTHRIRTIDPGFWDHPKTLGLMRTKEGRDAVLLIVGIRSTPVDDAGRLRADPLSLKATIFPTADDITPERIDEFLNLLESARLIHRYSIEGTAFAVVHDWLEWQRIDKPSPSMIPPSPPELCRCCDPVTMRRTLRSRGIGAASIRRLLGERSPNGPGLFDENSPNGRRTVDAGGEGRGQDRRGQEQDHRPPSPASRDRRTIGEDEGSPDQKGPKACGWCEKPQGEGAPTIRLLVQHYHDEYVRLRGRCPKPILASPGEAIGTFNRLLVAGENADTIRAVITHGLQSENRVLQDMGFTPGAIGKMFEGIREAMTEGVTHGDARGRGTRSSRRVPPETRRTHPPSERSSFGETGGVDL